MGKHWLFVAAAWLSVTGCSKHDEPKPAEPDHAETKALMAGQVQPAAQTYWDAVQYISNESGTHEIRPRTDAEWTNTLKAAQSLKQLGEELGLPAHAAGRGTDWKDFSQGLVDVAGQAEQAARSHDPEKVLEVGGTLYNVCSACHEVYMPGPAGLAPVDAGANKASN